MTNMKERPPYWLVRPNPLTEAFWHLLKDVYYNEADQILSLLRQDTKDCQDKCPKGGEHRWGIDGQHSNIFCKKCFIDKPEVKKPCPECAKCEVVVKGLAREAKRMCEVCNGTAKVKEKFLDTQHILRDTPKRLALIQKIESLCKTLNMPIEVDLREYEYSELMLAYIRLQLGKKNNGCTRNKN